MTFVRHFDANSESEAKAVRADLLSYLSGELDGQDLVPVEIIFAELVSNVAKHGNRQVRIELTWSGEGDAVIDVSDHGPGVDLSQWRPPPTLSESGRGLVIVGGLVENTVVGPGPGGEGTRVQVVLPFRRQPKTP